MTSRITVIGTGNLAAHFIPALHTLKQIDLVEVVGREPVAKPFIKNLRLKYTSHLQSISREIDAVYLMVNDAAIRSLSHELVSILPKTTNIVHFSGTMSLDEIDPYFVNRANVWPIQSISANDDHLPLGEIPISISASSVEILEQVESVFKEISNKIIHLSEKEKADLHLAAVLANNFTNHLYTLSNQYLEEKAIDFQILLPLISHSVDKLKNHPPGSLQTGPAVRKDYETINKHLEMLHNRPQLKAIYDLLSKSIITNS